MEPVARCVGRAHAIGRAARAPSEASANWALGAVLAILAPLALVSSAGAAPDLGGYVFATQDDPGGPRYEWVEIAGNGTREALMSCGPARPRVTTPLVPLGFDTPFTFYGQAYGALRANVFGQVLFDPVPFHLGVPSECDNPVRNGIATCSGWSCPPGGSALPNRQIAAYWSGFGIDPRDHTSGIYHRTMGPPGARVFIFEWHNMMACPYGLVQDLRCSVDSRLLAPPLPLDHPGGPNSFQVKLFEGSDQIEVHYKETNRPGGTHGSTHGYTVLGIEGLGTVRGGRWEGLAYRNSGVATMGISSYEPPDRWAIRYLRNQPPQAAFVLTQDPSPRHHDADPGNDGAQPGVAEPKAFHPGVPVALLDVSTDPDLDAVHASWSFGDGTPAQAGPVVAHTYALPGRYTLTLEASDLYGRSLLSEEILVQANDPPNADFAVDGVPGPGQQLSFRDLSTDPDGEVEARWWEFGDGASSAAEAPRHAFQAAGSYEVRLTVRDDDGASRNVTRPVAVREGASGAAREGLEEPPTAEAGEDQRVRPGTLVRLNGHQANGHAEAYQWAQVAGPRVKLSGTHEAQATFTAPQVPIDAAGQTVPARLQFQFTVMDGGRHSAPDTVTVVVEGPNQNPTIQVAAPPQAVAGGLVRLEAATRDPEGSAVAVAWRQVDGPTVVLAGNGTRATFTAPAVQEPTPLVFVASASDPDGGQAQARVAVLAVPPEAGFTVRVDGAVASFMPLVVGQHYAWEFGDGRFSSEARPTHRYAASGTYAVRLLLSDLDGTLHIYTGTVDAYASPAAMEPAAAAGRTSPPVGATAAAAGVLACGLWLAMRRRA